MKPIKALLLGAGSRGMYTYGDFALRNPGVLQIVAAAEPVAEKRRQIQKEHHIAPEYLYTTWEDAFKKLPPVEAVIIATQDQMHTGPIIKSMEANLQILCEKPIVNSLEDCHSVEKTAAGFKKIFMVAHVLKYTTFFCKLKELLDQGRIGRLVGINLTENVGHIHMSHSFVRGNWRNTAESSPMILQKSCHDMDILAWLAGSPCETLSSYGSLNYFKAENAPKGAPKRCLEGCPHMNECPYHVAKIYLGTYTGWPVNVITTDLSLKGRMKALEEGPYGRCVFHCDNDVVDHQTVSMRFTNNVMANFTMSAFTMATHRNITLFGSAGEITGDMEDMKITVKDFSTRDIDSISLAEPLGGHSGGDSAFISDFAACVRGEGGVGRNMVRNSFESHYMAFAAEDSRLGNGKLVRLEDYRKRA
ncbi:MAG: Gfo/Idh/MocA family oxidoreductase [Treponema sp.]|nr:Gfo/Idh/MocA family oxidoreductase [Treponema sp.]